MIVVDRLVLDVNGMTPERAARLAETIGALMADTLPAPAARLDVLLPPGVPDDAAILSALSAALARRAV